MYNTGLMKFKRFRDEYGSLTPIEGKFDIPFEIKRVYYISEVAEAVRRGFHSHKQLHQVLICLNGSVRIEVKTPKEGKAFELNDSSVGLYIGPMIWREMYDFTPGSVLLVLASEHYDEKDYIRDINDYFAQAKSLFE